MTRFRSIFIVMAVAGLVLASVVPASAQRAPRATDCLSDRQIQAAIESGTIQSWPRIKRLAGISAYEEVSQVQVCLIGNVPYYILNVVSPAGEASKIVLNAVDGTQELL